MCSLARAVFRRVPKLTKHGVPRKTRSDKNGKHNMKHAKSISDACTWCAKKDMVLIPAKTMVYDGGRYGSSMPKGFMDTILLEPHWSTRKFMAIEMKPEQEEWFERMTKRGMMCAACLPPAVARSMLTCTPCPAQLSGGNEL